MKKTSSRNRDGDLLREAARLARKGLGEVEPNPMVGALLVRGRKIVARGYHARYGGPHAEIMALRKAGAQARGATLYVTLEPCSSSGKTPPCTEAILRAGVKKVVVGATDPNPRHQGAGLALLKKAGLAVQEESEKSCADLLHRFSKYLKARKPQVILKWAMTLDGRIAARDSSSMWISGEASRRWVQRLRGHVDAVMVGSRTALLDDPRLNSRFKGAALTPVRVVLDPRLETPPAGRLLEHLEAGCDEDGFPVGPVWILAGAKAPARKAAALEKAGAQVIRLDAPLVNKNRFLGHALRQLRKRGIHRLLVEGGAGLHTSMIEGRHADQVAAFIAPKIIGGKEALSPVGGKGLAPMDKALQLSDIRTRRSGEDLLLQGFLP